MRPLGHNPHHILRHHLRRQPTSPRPRDRTHDDPAPGLHKLRARVEEIRRVRDMLDDLEQGQDIILLVGAARPRQALDRRIQVGQLAVQGRVAAGVGLRNGEHLGRRVDGGHARGAGEPGGALGEDPAAAADVEKAEVGTRRRGLRGVTAADEVVAEGVHEVEEARGAMGIPPRGGEGVEVRDFDGIDG